MASKAMTMILLPLFLGLFSSAVGYMPPPSYPEDIYPTVDVLDTDQAFEAIQEYLDTPVAIMTLCPSPSCKEQYFWTTKTTRGKLAVVDVKL